MNCLIIDDSAPLSASTNKMWWPLNDTYWFTDRNRRLLLPLTLKFGFHNSWNLIFIYLKITKLWYFLHTPVTKNPMFGRNLDLRAGNRRFADGKSERVRWICWRKKLFSSIYFIPFLNLHLRSEKEETCSVLRRGFE